VECKVKNMSYILKHLEKFPNECLWKEPMIITHQNLSMKQGSLFVCLFVCFVLFCTYEIHRTGMLQIVFLVSLESS
jgi:hypothetical protein